MSELAAKLNGQLRVGAVSYLNAQPLTLCLQQLAPQAQITVDLPSRLADGLNLGRLDVALVPSIEYARNPGYTIVSDACVACDGPVQSVKLYGRVPVERIRTLALDEGSRTSAAMTQILLREQYGVEPEIRPLPIGASLEDTDADAAMLIGDRGMLPQKAMCEFEWDLGERWQQWSGLPFVFAMWIARPGVELQDVDRLLAAARDEGVRRFDEIARLAAGEIGVTAAQCVEYLRDHLQFQLGDRQQQGLKRFYELAGRYGLAPTDVELVFCGDT